MIKFKAMRLDDNGNIFEMKVFEDLEEAKAYVKMFEARAHKQTYWVEAYAEETLDDV